MVAGLNNGTGYNYANTYTQAAANSEMNSPELKENIVEQKGDKPVLSTPEECDVIVNSKTGETVYPEISDAQPEEEHTICYQA